MKYKLGVIGSRNWPNKNMIIEYLNNNINKISCIVSGGAKGVDTIAENWAKENNIDRKIFLADWNNTDVPNAIIKYNKFGKKYNANAGFIRNTDIINYSDLIIAFRYNMSPGTTDSINKAIKLNKKIKIFDL